MSNNSRRQYEPQRVVVEAPQPPAVAAPAPAAPQVVVAAPAVQSSSKQSQKPKPDISFGDAFQLFLSVLPSPHRAVERLYAAWCEEDCHLWCEGNLLDPNYIRRLLTVEARPEGDGRWRAEIKPVRGENWDKSTYNWELSTFEVAALLADLSSDADPEVVEQLIEEKVSAAVAALAIPKDGIDGRDGAVGPVGPPGKDADPEVVKQLIDERLSAAATSSQQRKRGPKAGWRFVAGGEAYNFHREHGRMPSFKELADRCRGKLEDRKELDETATYKLLRILGAAD
jgi:hypothetical protein